MTSPSVTADLTMRFNRWLKRFSPPKQIAGDTEILQDEANAILRIVLQHAPDVGAAAWWDKVTSILEASMTTRSWPAPGQVVIACKSARGAMPANQQGENILAESFAIQRITDWFHKFKNEMPGMGRSDRTAVLIRNGLFKDEREARFFGFTLSPEQWAKAKQQAPGAAEQDHDRKVMAKFEVHPVDGRNAAPSGFKTIGSAISSHAAE